MKKLFYSWEQFDKDIASIVYFIKKKNLRIRAIYAIPKGGLVLGTALANILDLKLFCNYQDIRNHMYYAKQVLIVDDISDTGETFLKHRNIQKFTTVTLFIKKGTKHIPNFYTQTCGVDQWVCFPWEENEHIKGYTSNCKRNSTSVGR